MPNWREEFGEKYFDRNTPSGLNQKEFTSFPALVKDIEVFIQSKFEELIGEIPDDAVIEAHLDRPQIVGGKDFKQQLRERWLSN